MPQEFQILRCFSCETFQVDIVKKKNDKWQCKLCGEKQSNKRIYGRAWSAKECREQVQKLNEMRGQITDDKAYASLQTKMQEEEKGTEF